MSEAQVAIVTGASRGIGAAIAERLAKDGARVACTATSLEAAAATADRLTGAHGVLTLPIALRVEDAGAVDEAFSRVEAELGPISVVVNNAGRASVRPFVELTPTEFADVMAVNLNGVFHGAHAGATRMVASNTAGSIVQIGSVGGIGAFPKRVGYCTSKAAVHHMTRAMALDLAPYGIRVNCVAPGYVRTDLVDDLIAAGKLDDGQLRRRIPLGELGSTDDIAAAVAWLASDEARYVTGEIVVVDGGWAAYGHV